MNKLLVEIGTEEIPSSYIPAAADALKEITEKKFLASALPHGDITAYGSPRRLVLLVEGLPEKQELRSTKISGPPKERAFDKDGKPTKAAEGFVKKFGCTINELQFESTKKGEYTFLMVQQGGEDSVTILETLIPRIIASIPFPKTMRWGDKDMRFGRPIRRILAILDKRKIEFSLGGIQSGGSTFGDRFMKPGPLKVGSPDKYEEILEKAGVFVNPLKRKEIIGLAFDALEKEHKIRVVRDPELVETVCYLTENPVAVLGSFEKSYLDLPRELLITVMKHHQRYFSVESMDGSFSNMFVGFSNIECKDLSVVRRGYERVLSARLADARFFFDEDRKQTLSQFAAKLSGTLYIKGLGTIADKTERTKKIAVKIAEILCPKKVPITEKAALLCKADLATLMVYEFPELQGVMGREYAKHEGLDEETAIAIDEHYSPRFSGDLLPSTDTGRFVALADKMETLAGCFAIGLLPTGSEDPFSLRRHALGIIRILLDSCDGLSLSQLVEFGVRSLPENLQSEEEKTKKDILEFLRGRIKSEFMARGLSYDVIDAVLAAGFGDLPDTLRRCEALAGMKKEDYSENLAITFKRAANIVREHDSDDVDESALKEKEEKDLFKELIEREKKVSPLVKERNYADALKEIAKIRSKVDIFFDRVMVMVDDTEIRKNRLSLLKRLTRLFEDLADFSKLVFKEGQS